jgi:hypothetical protein
MRGNDPFHLCSNGRQLNESGLSERLSIEVIAPVYQPQYQQ